ncbi:MAG: glycosyltransferase [Verrucomicrobia bacterium]|nr:glycosyltransferase [Verrucomicrobiota bacterium]
MKVSVIITAYRGAHLLKRVLHEYLFQSRQPDEIIVAEDAEDLNIRHLISSKYKRNLKIVHVCQKDEGYRRSTILNKSIAASDGDYIILSDADCLPHKSFVKDHADYARPNQFILGTRAYVDESIIPSFKPTLPRRLYHAFKKQIFPRKVSFRLPYINWDSNTDPLGANMSFWKEDLIKVNGFNNDFIGWGHEDMELISRMKNVGLKNLFLHQQCILYHLNHPILSREDESLNTQLWNESKARGDTWGKNGLDRYLSTAKESLIKTTFKA